MHPLEIAAKWAWDTSLAACILLIPTLLLRHPRSLRFRDMLGLLIVARLLLPFTIPSPLSILNLLTREASWSAAPRRRFGSQRPEPPTIQSPLITASTPVPALTPKQGYILPILWTLGFPALSARIAFQHVKIHRATRPQNQITSGPALEALNSALELSACGRHVKIYSVPNLSTPALFGFFRPSILLPPDLAQSANLTRLRLVFLHELAHLKRGDVLINWLMIVAQSLHWFNPLVWLAMRRLRADQELLCDTDVMRILNPSERHTYGETLLALAAPRGHALSTLIPVSTSFKQLKERIAMIKQFNPATRRALVFALPALAAILAVVTFTAAADKQPTQPPEKKPASAATDAEARDKSINALQDQFEMQTVRVRELQSRVDELRKNLGIVFEVESEVYQQDVETLRRIEADRSRAEQEYVQFEKLLGTFKGKKREDLIQMIPTAYRDEALDRLLDKLATAEQQRAALAPDFSDDHPDVKRVTSTIKTIRRQIEERLDGVLAGLEAIVSSRKAIFEQLSKKTDELKIRQVDTLERARPYFQAKRDLETLQKFRDTLYIQLLQRKSERELGR